MRTAVTRFRLHAMVGALALAFAAPSHAAPDIDAKLKAMAEQIESLQKQLRELQAASAAAAPSQATAAQAVTPVVAVPATAAATTTVAAVDTAPAKVVTEGSLPNSWKLPGTNTSVKVGGYIKLDVIKDISGGMGGNPTMISYIPVKGSPLAHHGDNFYMSARESRLNLATSTPTAWGELYTFIEGDFYGAGGGELYTNSSAFRLRHAYGKMDRWLAGQWWSNFANLDAFPETLDFNGAVGLPNATRSPQLRYAMPLGTDELAFAIENPEADFFGANTISFQTGQTMQPLNFTDKVPDLTARYQLNRPWGNVAVAGVLRRMTIDNTGGTPINGFVGEDSVNGYGLLVSGRYNYSGNSGLLANFTTGEGIARYIFGSPGFDEGGSDSAAIVDGKLKATRSSGVTLGVQHFWSNQLRSSFTWGAIKTEHPHPAYPLTAIGKQQSFHVNTLWNPLPPLTLGLEYIYARIENDTQPTETLSNKGDASRIQAGAILAF
ncbi:DcaP family trimeric outer membrane transporter [Niveibacterium sp. SC-1]|uniref:DcaP family trimeric outer membrane transporter n=1 Tax=Niveibacterium sp. SC-1 TaxID=3135646 RepID=UPI00311FED37